MYSWFYSHQNFEVSHVDFMKEKQLKIRARECFFFGFDNDEYGNDVSSLENSRYFPFYVAEIHGKRYEKGRKCEIWWGKGAFCMHSSIINLYLNKTYRIFIAF